MANELRGGLKGEVGTLPVFTLPEGTAGQKIDASSIDELQLADAVLKGRPYMAGASAVRLCQREKMGADGLAVHLAVCFSPEEIAYMLALSLVTLGAK